MSQLLSDPRMIDYLVSSQPQLQAMGPNIREVMQSEEFRRTMTDPVMLRQMFEMNRMFSQMGMQMPGAPPAPRQPSFPAPGVTNTTAPRQGTPTPTGTTSPPPQNPFEAIFPPQQGSGGAPQSNPFMALFQNPYTNPVQPTSQQTNLPPPQPLGSPLPQQPSQQPPLGNTFSVPPTSAAPPAQPDLTSFYSLLQNLSSMQQTLGGAPQAAPAPVAADTRPLEERYQVSSPYIFLTIGPIETIE
jgi:hypothetical protein